MNKKGFTLTELLAVLVILTVVMLIGSFSINGIKAKMNKNMFEAKLDLVIGAAKSWGQDNKEALDVSLTVGELIANNTLQTDERVSVSAYPACEVNNLIGSKCAVVTNNVDGSVINKLDIKIYIEYNRVYACIEKNTNNKNVLKETATWGEYADLNYYCS
ncbi:MAG: prepilin-type N-terminal cleavage/methylation domain-containing protein [Firmicutes bacterium]|nr:prepilin-type N-terminal cleavage/methylation domain-containing protein [Bacillota bacterium]